MESEVQLEILTPRGDIVPVDGEITGYALFREPWDNSEGEIVLAIRLINKGLSGAYIVRDNLLRGDLASRWKEVLAMIARGERIRVIQKRPWGCECGELVSSTFCPHCGRRAFIETEVACGREMHDNINEGRYCPVCGVGVARKRRRREI